MRPLTSVILLCLAVLVCTGAAYGALCDKCQGKMFTADIGQCVACGGGTSSGAFKLCRACSQKQGQCECCRAPLKGPPPAKRADPEQKAPAGQEIAVAEDQHGAVVNATVGQTLVVSLRGNPTTGFMWRAAKLEGGVIEQAGEPAYAQAHPEKKLVGGGGTFTFRFRALKEGKATLTLEYARPWEKDQKPAKTFSINVVVAAAK